MRDIKFRAWSKDLGMISHDAVDDWEVKELNERFIDGGIRPQECFVMQYTGLKDKNGTDIYEGDIVDTRYGRMTVRWDEYQSGFDPFRGDINCPDAEHETEVIGNIYENPELLETPTPGEKLDNFRTEILNRLQFANINPDADEAKFEQYVDEIIQSLVDFIEEEKRQAALEAITKNVTLQADLAWCIGKLAGLGHPAEHLEEKYRYLWERQEKDNDSQR